MLSVLTNVRRHSNASYGTFYSRKYGIPETISFIILQTCIETPNQSTFGNDYDTTATTNTHSFTTTTRMQRTTAMK